MGPTAAAIGAFFLGLAMERYRRSQALLLELGKARAAAIVRSAENLARLDRLVWQVIGGPFTAMGIDDYSDASARFLRERVTKRIDELIAESNATGSQISADLVVLGDEIAITAMNYFSALQSVYAAAGSPSVPLPRVAQLAGDVPRARSAFAKLFPRIQAP